MARHHDRAQVVLEDAIDQLLDAGASRAPRDQIGPLLERIERVGDGHAAFAGRQHRVIVFRVTDRDRIAHRQAELLQGQGEPRLFVHARREQHHGALVEDDLPLEAELADHLDGRDLIRLARRHDHPAGVQRGSAALAQPLRQGGRGWFRHALLLARLRPVEKSAVFGHHQVEEIEPVEDRLQIPELAAGDQHHAPAALAQALYCGHRLRTDGSLLGERPVVVRRHREISHGGECAAWRAGLQRPRPPARPVMLRIVFGMW